MRSINRTFVVILPVLGVLATATPVGAADGTSDSIDTTTVAVVVALTICAFVGAVIAGRRASRAPAEHDWPFREDLATIDLLGSQRAPGGEPKIVRVAEMAFLAMLLLYALFDRGFAWLHVPGTPLFVGELTLVLALVAMSSRRVGLPAAIRQSPPYRVLLVWMGWGMLFLVAHVPEYGVNAIRDSALWYYGVVAAFVLFLLLSDPTRYGRWADLFGTVLPFVLAWFPVAVAMDSLFGRTAPFIPDSEIPVFAHRFGNIAVLAAIGIGFIWLVDRERHRFSATQRNVYTVLGAVGILLAGFQNRGGLVSAVVGVVVMLLFMRRRRGELTLVLASVAILIATFAVVTEIRIPISSGREISAAQMMDNITSVINPDSGGARQTGTTEWRLELWSRVVDEVTTDHPIAGFGPGENLGLRFDVTGDEEVPLRNPHNSHIGVLARMGWIGVGLWALLWIVWAVPLLQLRTWLKRNDRPVEAGLAAWLFVSALMILINAIFDPTLEGPQVAFWLWVIFGVGAAMPLAYMGVPRRIGELVGNRPSEAARDITVSADGAQWPDP